MKLNLLIVDDSRISRKQSMSLIEIDKYNISEAGNGQEAMDLLSKNKYDIIFLDLLMPEIDGFDVLQFINEKKIDIKSIVMSADIQESTAQKIKELKAYSFLNKPVSKDKLREVLENIEKELGS